MSTSPEQVVMDNPVVFTDTVRVPGVLLFCWETINQPFPQPTPSLVVALNDTAAPVLVAILSV
jgi:hypothetical protein